ncbi:hypothetical protein LUD75_18915 [Epilithonimonas sp. JDS]|uniref:hypothetical protein n=1 Tax=Epilithonimonas sp. JDS TaxID=2902797 RepID=UPI001E331A78|nr:hypothetical protein [Epilithonimonas sp. JDS]MCD9856803.1 hypothetical protein [Epilithonimonas sp. JDS]
MTKNKITDTEIPLVLKKFNKSLALSTVIFPFIFTVICLPIYFLFFFLTLFLTGENNSNLLTLYIGTIIFLVFINFLYCKIVINKRIKDKEIYKITQNFTIQKKDNYTYTSENVSNSDYYRLNLLDEKKDEIGIYISKDDYYNVREGQSLNLTYYELLDIPVEGYYNHQKLEFFKFFIIKKWSRLKQLLPVLNLRK